MDMDVFVLSHAVSAANDLLLKPRVPERLRDNDLIGLL